MRPRPSDHPSGARLAAKPRAGRLLLAICLACAFLLCPDAVPAAAAPAPASPDPARIGTKRPNRTALLLELRQAMDAGDLPAAREAVRRYRAAWPGEPLMAYNQACIDARLGDKAAALQAMREAFDLGFDDVRMAASDPDLEPLAADPGFRDLIAAREDTLRAVAARRRLIVPENEWTDPLPMAAYSASRATTPAHDCAISLRFTPEGVDFELRVGDLAESWRDGDRLLLTLAPLDSPDDFDSDRPFRFVFGLAGGSPIGMLASRPDLRVEQALAELGPRIDRDGETAAWTCSGTIPWALLAPYSPPVDRLWGVNAAFVSRERSRPWSMLAPDRRGFDPRVGWARTVPAVLRLGPDSPARLGVEVSDTVAGADPLRLGVVIWSPEAGVGTLHLAVVDGKGKPVVSLGESGTDLELSAGLNLLERQTGLSGISDGLIDLNASVRLPGGETLKWSTPLLRFGPNWLPAARKRLEKVDPLERPSVAVRLDLIEETLASRDPREDPSPLATTVNEVDNMLLLDRDTGSVLPAGGAITAAYESIDGSALPCDLRLPDGWIRGGGSPAAVVLAGGGGSAGSLWKDISALRSDAGAAELLAMPACRQPAAGPWPEAVRADAAAAIEWVLALAGAGSLSLVALESAPDAALEFAAANPGLVERVLVVADGSGAPWPAGAAAEYASRRIAAPVAFASAGGKLSPASSLAAALEAGGAEVETLDLPKYPTPADIADLVAGWLSRND